MKQKLTYKQAHSLALRIKAVLAPACERIEIAGSIRRKKQEIGDIELVAIPKLNNDLFGLNHDLPTKLDDLLTDLVLNQQRLKPGKKNGTKAKQFIIPASNTQVDLFLPTIETWPIIYSIRTGSAEFSKRLVTQVSKGGLLFDEYRISGGRVWLPDNTPIPIEDEREFFSKFLMCGWLDPVERV